MFETLRAKQPGTSLSRILFYELAAWVMRVLSWLFYRTKTIDPHKVPALGPVLLAGNHQSLLDPPLMSIRIRHRHLNFVAKSGLFSFRPFAYVISLLNAIPLREDTGDTAAIRETIARLERGGAVLIFPEGSRSPDGAVDVFKRGVALLVKKAKCPVVPVAIEGAFDAWPIHRGVPNLFGCHVYVKYGDPIDSTELLKDGPDAGLEILRLRIEAMRRDLRTLLREETQGRYPAPGLGDEPLKPQRCSTSIGSLVESPRILADRSQTASS